MREKWEDEAKMKIITSAGMRRGIIRKLMDGDPGETDDDMDRGVRVTKKFIIFCCLLKKAFR